MKPYILYCEHVNNQILIHAIFLESVVGVSISNNYILIDYRDSDTNTNNIVPVGHSSCPILQDVVDELNDWKHKIESGQTRKCHFSITNSIMKHERDYMQRLYNFYTTYT